MESNQKLSFYRILLVEDDRDRAGRLIAYMPKHIKVVHAASSGRAIGVIRADHRSRKDKSPYAGIMLDHDLQQQAVCAEDFQLSGMNVVDAIISYVPKSIPILIHSMNYSQSPIMVTKLEKAGFNITRIPMQDLTTTKLLDWLTVECEIPDKNY